MNDVLQFGGLYPHAFQVILWVNFKLKDRSNFKTCHNAVGLSYERHHYLICILQKKKTLTYRKKVHANTLHNFERSFKQNKVHFRG